MTRSVAGTPYFMAPEVLLKVKYNYKADIWSLGVLLYFMLFREYPFKMRFNAVEEIMLATKPHFNIHS